MQKIVKDSAKILRNNLIVIQPLLLYLLFVLTILTFVLSKHVYLVPKVVLIISMVLLTIAFTAGWIHINKYCILTFNESDSPEEIATKSIQNFKKFFEGVGKDFLKTTGLYIIISLIYAIAIFGTMKLCLMAFGEPKLVYEIQKISNISSQAELLNVINNIPLEDKITFSHWILTINTVTSILNLLTIVYLASSTFDGVDVFKSLWNTVKFSFKNIFNLILIALIMFVIYIGVNLFVMLLGSNSVAFVISTILFTMYLNYYLILVFYFYYDKTKNNSNNRTEFIG